VSRVEKLLGTDFDGQPVSDVDDIIYEALDDPDTASECPGWSTS
jgi:hypothetical protein